MRIITAATTVLCLASLFRPLRSDANPWGGAVVGGDDNATITGEGTRLVTITQNRNRAIINWDTFSIGVGEMTKFVQPSATAAILNRVLSATPSELYGTLQANGRVFLINSAGILVGPGGVVNTRGFVASTFDIANNAFRSAANLTLAGASTASVRNEGTIRGLGGDVFLIANTVENSGTIKASGTVGLAAGSKILLAQSGAERIAVQAGNAAAAAQGTGVNNQGQIEAATAELKAAGGNIYALAINNGGAVRANTVVNQGGRIYLRSDGGNIQNGGTLSASSTTGNGGQVIVDGGHNAANPATVINTGTIEAASATGRGGTVNFLGDYVGLFDQARIDVSGATGGGTALVGGDFQGKNPAIHNAQQTIVAPNAVIDASATRRGDGGQVVVWADELTRFYGTVRSRGGLAGGDGGAVEVSGKKTLGFYGTADLAAPAGQGGRLLLDPRDVTIANTGGASNYPGPISFTNNPSSDMVIRADSLTNVNVDIQANRDIDVRNDVTGDGDLSLRAGRDITLENNVAINRNGTVFMSANDEGATGLATRNGPGGITMNSGASIFGTNITLRVGDFRDDGVAVFEPGGMSLQTVTSSGWINIHGGRQYSNPTLNNPLVTFHQPVTANQGVFVQGEEVRFDNSAGNNGSLVATGALGTVTLAPVTGSRQITISTNASTADGMGLDPGDLADNIRAARLVLGVGTNANNIVFETSLTITNKNLSFDTISNVALSTFDVSLPNHTLTVHADNGIAGSGLVSATNVVFLGRGDAGTTNASLRLSTAAITLGSTNAYGGNAFLSNSSPVNFTGASTGNVTLANSGIVTQNSSLSISGTLALNAGNNDVLLNNPANNFNRVSVHAANASLADVNDVTITNSTITTDLNVSAAGSLSITNVQVGNNASLRAGNNGTLDTVRVTNNLALTATNGNNVLRVVSVGGSAYLTNGGSLTLNTLDVANDLTARSGGAVRQTGVISVTNNLTVETTGNNVDVILSNANNYIGQNILVTNSSGFIRDLALGNAAPGSFTNVSFPTAVTNLTLNFVNSAVELPGVQVANNLSVWAGGNITQTNSLFVGGSSSLRATNYDVTLDNLANNFVGPVSVFANNATLADANALTLGASILQTNLSVIAGGSVNQTGVLNVGSNLNVSISGNDVDVLLGFASNVIGANITVTNTAGWVRDIALANSATNSFNLVSFPTVVSNLSLTFLNSGVALNGVTVASNLFVLAGGGDITQSNAVVVGRDTTLLVGNGYSIYLTTNGNLFLGSLSNAALSGSINNLELRNEAVRPTTDFAVSSVTNLLLIFPNSGLRFGPTTVVSNMTVNAGGNITQTGVLIVGGTNSLTTLPGSDILLADYPNIFGGPIIVAAVGAGGSGLLHDLAVRNIATNSFALPVGFDLATNSLTLIFDNSSVALPGLSLTNDLTVVSGGTITQNGRLQIGGTTHLAATNSPAVADPPDILLATYTNNFVGPVLLRADGSAELRDEDNLSVGDWGSTIHSNLTLIAGGDISQVNSLTVSNDTFLSAGGNITLENVANDFGGLVTVANGLTVSLADANSLSVTGASFNLTAAALGGDLTFAGYQVANNLAARAGRDILQTNALRVGNAAGLSAGRNIALTNVGNDFLGLVTVTNGLDVRLTDANQLTVGGASSNLTATALGGNLTFAGYHATNDLTGTAANDIQQTAALVVGNMSVFTAANNITLNNGANDFAGPVQVNAQNATVFDSTNNLQLQSAVVVNTLARAFGGDLLIAGSSRNVDAGAQRDVVFGAYNAVNGLATAGQDIRQTGDLSFSGNTTLGAGRDITLNRPNNDFGGSVNVLNGLDVVLADANSLTVLGTSSNLTASARAGDIILAGYRATNNLTLGASRDILQTAPVTVGNATDLSAGRDIALTQAGNDFGGLVAVSNGLEVALTDANDLRVTGTSSNLTVAALGGDLILAGYHATNNLGARASRDILQTAPLTVGGATGLSAGRNIALTDPANDFVGRVTVTNGLDVSLADANNLEVAGASFNLAAAALGGDLTFAGYAVGNNLGARASHDILQTAALTVGGATGLSAGRHIDLSNTGNDFGGRVTVTNGLNVTLTDANALTVAGTSSNLTATAITGDLTLAGYRATNNLAATAGNNLLQTAALTVGATSTLSAGQNIQLDNPGNDFGGLVDVLRGRDVTLVDGVGNLTVTGTSSNLTANAQAGNLTFEGYRATNNLTASAAGDILQTAALYVTNVATLLAPNGNITLNNATNDFNLVSVLGHDVVIVDANTFTLFNAAATNLTLAASNDLALAGVNVAHDLEVTAGHDASITTTAVGHDATVTAGNDAALTGVNVANDLALTTGRDAALSSATIGRDLGVSAGRDASLATVTVGRDATVTAGNDAALTGVNVTNDLALAAGRDAALSSATIGRDLDVSAGRNASLATVTVGRDGVVDAGGNITADNVSVARNLTGVATNGSISGLGTLTVGSLATLRAANGDVSFANANNDLNVVEVRSRNATLADRNSLTVSNSTVTTDLAVTAAGDANLVEVAVGHDAQVSAGTNVTLNAVSVTNNLTALAANGSISGARYVTVGQLATLFATNGNVTLTSPTNDFNLVQVRSHNATLVDRNSLIVSNSVLNANLAATAANDLTLIGVEAGLDLAASAGRDAHLLSTTVARDAAIDAGRDLTLDGVSIAHNLAASATNGNISGAGTLTVGGLARLSAVNGDVTLANLNDDFNVVQVHSHNASLADRNSLTISNSTLTTDLSVRAATDANLVQVSAGHDVAVSAGANVALNSVSAANNLTAVATNGGISGAGVVTVGQWANLQAANGDVVLANPNNDFNNVLVRSRNATLMDRNSLTVTNPVVTVDLSVTAADDLSLIDAQISGNALLSAGHNASVSVVALPVSVVGGNLEVFARNNANIANARVGQDAAINAGNDQTLENLSVAHDLAAIATNGSISSASVVTAGHDARFTAGNNLAFTTLQVTNNLIASAVNGGITGGGVTTIGALTTLGAGQDIRFGDPGNDFVGRVAVLRGRDVTLADRNDLEVTGSSRNLTNSAGGNLNLAGYTVTNNLVLSASGQITQSSNVVAGDNASLRAGGNILLGNTTNAFGSIDLVSTNGTQVLIGEQNDTLLGDVTATKASVIINSGGIINQKAGTAINAKELAASAAEGVSLTNHNDVQNLAGTVTNRDSFFEFTDTNALTVTTVAGVNGIRATAPGSRVALNADQIGITTAGISAGTNLVVLQPFSASGVNLGLSGTYTNDSAYSGLNNVNAGILRVGNSNTFSGNIVINHDIVLGNTNKGPFDPLAQPGDAATNATTLALYTRGQILGTNNGSAIIVPRLSLIATNVVLHDPNNDVYFLAGRIDVAPNSPAGFRFDYVEANNLDWLFVNPQSGGILNHLTANFDGAHFPGQFQAMDLFLPTDEGIFGFSPLGLGRVSINPNKGTEHGQDLQRGFNLFVEVKQPRQTISIVTFDFKAKDIEEKIKQEFGPETVWQSFALVPFEKPIDVEETYKVETLRKWVPGAMRFGGSTAGPQQGP